MKVRVNSAEIHTDVFRNGRRKGQQYKFVLFHLGPVSRYMAGSQMNETFYRMFNPAVVQVWDSIQGTVDAQNPNVKVIDSNAIKKALADNIIEDEDLYLGTTTPMNTAIDVINWPLDGQYKRHDGNHNPVLRADGKEIIVDSVELVLMKVFDDTANQWKYAASDEPAIRAQWLLERYYDPVNASNASATATVPAQAAPPTAAPSVAQQTAQAAPIPPTPPTV